MPTTTAKLKQSASGGQAELQCPVCGKAILCESQGRPIQSQCPDCSTALWCQQRIERDLVFLDALPGAMPGIPDFAAIGQSPRLPRPIRGIVVNLRNLETLTSSYVAGLLVMHRLIDAAGGKLVLCELQPHVNAIFRRFNLQTMLTIVECEEDVSKAL